MSMACGSTTTVTFSDSSHIARVRRIAACVAKYAGMGQQESDDVALAVTEACVNAVRHGCPNGAEDRVVVSFTTDDASVTAEVTDSGRTSQIPGSPNGPEPGYGLRLIDELCDETAYACHAGALTLRLTKRSNSTSPAPAV